MTTATERALTERLADKDRMLANAESELRRVRALVGVVLDAESITLVINRAASHAHANTRPHAVAAAHAALAVLTEGGHPGDVGAALVKEMSKWLELTRKATLEQAAQTVSALR